MSNRTRRIMLMALEHKSAQEELSSTACAGSAEDFFRDVLTLPIQFDDGFILENFENVCELNEIPPDEAERTQNEHENYDTCMNNTMSELLLNRDSIPNFEESVSELQLEVPELGNDETEVIQNHNEDIEYGTTVSNGNVQTINSEKSGKEGEMGETVLGETAEKVAEGASQEKSDNEGEMRETVLGETAEKDADGASQAKKRKREKRIAVDRSQWKRNDTRNKRMRGEAYLGFTRSKEKIWKNDTQRTARTMGTRCTSKHSKIYKCNTITEESRKTLFSKFWSEMTWEQKKIYVVNHVEKSEPNRRRSENKDTQKTATFKYYLKNGDNNTRVCKHMFLNTLSLGEWSVRSWCQNSTSGTLPSEENVKKRRTASREAKGCTLKHSDRRRILESWLEDLPKLPSHYARRDTKKQYIEDNFIKSKSQLYKLYKEDCKETKPLSSFTFDEIFDKQNLGIFQPKKDQCNRCSSYKAGNFTTLTEIDYQCHIANKDRARIEKQTDKENSIVGNCDMVTMDLQAVQLCPRLYASKLYFKTKLRVHNFTMYNVATHQSTNFWWHEGEGEVNSSNFASCIIDYLYTQFKNSDKPIVLYSDGCGYQNRCTVISNALLTFAVKERKLIEQKYLCVGHTQMECDAVHSLIERRLDGRDIHWPAEYISVTKRAREKPFPLDTKYLTHDFFKDYACPEFQWYNSIRPGTSYVTDIKCLKYTPKGEIFYKIDFDSEYKPLRRNKTVPNVPIAYPNLYTTKPKITLEKYNQLIEITGVMEPEYGNFYKNLPHENAKRKKT